MVCARKAISHQGSDEGKAMTTSTITLDIHDIITIANCLRREAQAIEDKRGSAYAERAKRRRELAQCLLETPSRSEGSEHVIRRHIF
jgi:hypothetical protein